MTTRERLDFIAARGRDRMSRVSWWIYCGYPRTPTLRQSRDNDRRWREAEPIHVGTSVCLNPDECCGRACPRDPACSE